MTKFGRLFLITALDSLFACTPFNQIQDAGSGAGGAAGGVGASTGGTAGKTMTGSGGVAQGSAGSGVGGFPAGSGGIGSGGTSSGTGGAGAATGSGGSGGALAGTGGGAAGGAAGALGGGSGGSSSALCTEGATQSCGAAPLNKKGACGLDSATCQNGQWVGCKDTKGADTCEVGNDNNCNGTPNEGCPCVNGATQDCGHAAVGICKMGKSTCQNGVWSGCSGNVDPARRDCTSPLDNDCDGKPDDTVDVVCKCASGASQACGAHPGADGKGSCKAGSQSCVVASNKATADWGACTGSVGPAAADTCDANNDANCNGTPNEGCACVNGSAVTCACGPAATCANGVKGSCSVAKVMMYKDADGDGYGNAALPSQVCPGTTGYASNADDCDDNNGAFKPGVSICASVTQKSTCTAGGGGVPVPQACDQGCINGSCRTDGTIGLPGYVSCVTFSSPLQCLATDGCLEYDEDGTCGTTGRGTVSIYCDGPNDCPGQKCILLSSRSLGRAKCYASAPPEPGDPSDASYTEICDPLASTCTPPLACIKQGGYPLYGCQ